MAFSRVSIQFNIYPCISPICIEPFFPSVSVYVVNSLSGKDNGLCN